MRYPRAGQAVPNPSMDRPSNNSINPLDFLDDGPSSADLFAEAMRQVSGQYDAQIGNLDHMSGQARRRAKQNDAQLAAMYKALGREIAGQAGGIKSMWTGGQNAVRRNTRDANAAIGKIYGDSRNELGALFSRLGIQAAAPDALSGSEGDRNLLMGMNKFSENSKINAMESDKKAGLNFNTAQVNIANAAGKNRRADLAQSLTDTLNNIGMQRNTLMGQRDSAVAERSYQLEQQALDDQMALMKAMQGSESGGLSPSQQYSQLGPDERGAYKAQQMFGEQAPYAMELLQGVARNQNGGEYANGAHFIRSILAEDAKQARGGRPDLDDAMLQALASYYWGEGAVDRTPNSARPRQYG